MPDIPVKIKVFVSIVSAVLNGLNPSNYTGGFSDIDSAKKKKKKAEPKTRTLLQLCDSNKGVDYLSD